MKVGDYVRTKNYGIRKILDIGEYLGMKQYLIDEFGTYVIDNSIIKSNSNIKLLIEVGDYVNGYRVVGIETLPTKQKLVVVGYGYDVDEISENNIKSIVTKEQFEGMEYKL